MTVSKTRMGQARYTKFMTLPSLLEMRALRPALAHLLRLRSLEVRISDAEAALYGAIFVLLLGMILFNLRIATGLPDVTAGTIFSVISYSWEFVEGALALPVTLQSWTRLSEIIARINGMGDQATSAK